MGADSLIPSFICLFVHDKLSLGSNVCLALFSLMELRPQGGRPSAMCRSGTVRDRGGDGSTPALLSGWS